MPLFDRVTIVGLGLIGGSLGMVIRCHRLAREVVGYSRKPSTIRRALQRGDIDRGSSDLSRAVLDADLVVLATPVEMIVPFAKQAAIAMRAGGILTDVGSSKGAIARALERSLPRDVNFVGGHPLAGSEQRGLNAADAALFDDSVCLLTATPRTNRRALRVVKRLWSSIARHVVVMSPQRHDQLLAATSHLPHLIAYNLMATASRDGLAIAPRSFLDATRVAKSDPELWDEIFLGNRAPLLLAMSRFERHWRALRKRLIRGNRGALRRLLARAQSRRNALD